MKKELIELVEKRKKLWKKTHNIMLDDELRNSTVEYLYRAENKDILLSLSDYPETVIELFFTIIDKNSMTVPFFLNEAQRKLVDIINTDKELYKQKKTNHLKYLILKGRQQGITSFINAYAVASAITTPNFSGYTLADSSDNAEDIFNDKGKYYFDNLPERLKPSTKYNTRRELDFNNDKGKGLNSKWRVATANNKDAGRSKTLNFFHGSEVAFWDNFEALRVGLEEAFTKSCIVLFETTANGYNDFKTLWDKDNNYKSLFFEWWITEEYNLYFESKSIEEEFINRIKSATTKEPDDVLSESWVFSRLKWLYEVKNVTDYNKLYWYYNKWRDKGEDIKQEYPCTPDEAFLASGRNYFAVSEVLQRLDKVKDIQPKKAYFTYEFGTDPITKEKTIIEDSIELVVDDKVGFIKIFIEPKATETFVIGADTSGDGSDFNTAIVIDGSGTQYASVRLIEDEDLFSNQLYCLGYYFNYALISPEVNYSTYVAKTLINRAYPNVYTRQDSPDKFTQELTEKIGFNTNRSTRPMLLGQLRELVRDEVNKINDTWTLKEMIAFIITTKGRPEAMQGYHDDMVMAYGISLYSLNQIPLMNINRVEIPKGYYVRSELEDMGYPPYLIDLYLEKGVRSYDDI